MSESIFSWFIIAIRVQTRITIFAIDLKLLYLEFGLTLWYLLYDSSIFKYSKTTVRLYIRVKMVIYHGIRCLSILKMRINSFKMPVLAYNWTPELNYILGVVTKI